MDLLDRILEHDRWATAQLLELSRDLTDAQLDQPFDLGHRTLRETFDHMLYTIGFWTGFMVGQPIDPDRTTQDYDRSIAAMTERFERDYATFASVARRVRDEQRLDDTFMDHWDLPTTFGGTIIQVPQHNVEHRSEILHILQRLGLPDLPEVDHLLWEHTTQGG